MMPGIGIRFLYEKKETQKKTQKTIKILNWLWSYNIFSVSEITIQWLKYFTAMLDKYYWDGWPVA